MKNGSNFVDIGKESAVCGAIAAGTFEIVPQSALIPPDAFADPRWRIVYSVACALRSQISDKLVCPESVNDFVAFHGLDRELQTAIDSTKIIDWHRWPEFTDASQAYSPEGLSLQYSLSVINELYYERQSDDICDKRKERSLSRLDTIKALQDIEDLCHQGNGANSAYPLVDLADSSPDPTNTLLGNRFLCREGSMLFVGPSGIGKSSASIQQDLLWSVGATAFGIKPYKPLRILTIQAEDDVGDLSEMVSGVRSQLAFTTAQVDLSRLNCFYVGEKSRTGLSFLSDVVRPLVAKYQPDILRINPFQAYLGGDIKDPAITGAFLRNGINPILEEFSLGFILVHHTPKTNFRDTEEWKASDWMYAGAGSADITNWARAIMVMDPTTDPRIFKFIAAKRGSRVGWADDNGDSVTIRFFSHADNNSIHWSDSDESEIPDHPNNNGQFQNKFTTADILETLSAIDGLSVKQIRLAAADDRGMSKATFFRLWDGLKSSRKVTRKDGKWFRS